MVSSSETESSKNHDPKILSQYPHNLMYAQNMMNMASQQAYQWDMYGFMLSQQLQVQQLQQQVQLMQHMQSTSNIMNALMGNGVGVFSNEQDAKLVAGMQNMNSVQQQVFNAATSVPGNGTSSASGTNQQQPQGTSFDSTQNKNNNAAAAAQPQMDLLNFGNADANANANNANVVAPANNNDNAAANGANPANANAAAANGDAANPANQNIWARFRIGSIVKVALIMLLLEVKPVWFFCVFLRGLSLSRWHFRSHLRMVQEARGPATSRGTASRHPSAPGGSRRTRGHTRGRRYNLRRTDGWIR